MIRLSNVLLSRVALYNRMHYFALNRPENQDIFVCPVHVQDGGLAL